MYCPDCIGEGCPECWSLGSYQASDLIPTQAKDSTDIYVCRGYIDGDRHYWPDRTENTDKRYYEQGSAPRYAALRAGKRSPWILVERVLYRLAVAVLGLTVFMLIYALMLQEFQITATVQAATSADIVAGRLRETNWLLVDENRELRREIDKLKREKK
ncbi:MAG: hypothetical protein A2Y38_19030 [Spirochaetes bacterium GWB1_59_5]|nr:MAG: hypothetical protein A2Y38_19030 [Spirochaetes bacterium GWB1_59_5]